jgi:hypothetical protein
MIFLPTSAYAATVTLSRLLQCGQAVRPAQSAKGLSFIAASFMALAAFSG